MPGPPAVAATESRSMDSRGYGPATPSKRLFFDGNSENYELWEVKFMAYLRMSGLHKVLEAAGQADPDKNAEVYAAMVQFLDDVSLTLIMRDAPNDGKKAIGILRDHYLGSSKPRIISLYCELTSLKMAVEETVTEYVLRAETAASRLKNVNEVVSDSLLIAMIVKGLPESYRAFTTLVSQTDEGNLNLQKFKS